MLRLSSFLIVALLTIMSCKVVEDTQDNTLSIKSFRITSSDVTGWSFESGWEWREFTKNELNDLVDGDAPAFVDEGLIGGSVQKLTNSQKNEAMFWIMDFATEETASKMYTKYVSSNFKVQKSIAGFSQSQATLDDNSIEGCKTIVQFEQYLIVSFFTGYSDANISTTDAQQFLFIFQDKSGQ